MGPRQPIFLSFMVLPVCSQAWDHKPGCVCTKSLPSVQFSSVAQLCPTLYDPMNCSPPGSSVHWILQARIPEWVPISFPISIFNQNCELNISRLNSVLSFLNSAQVYSLFSFSHPLSLLLIKWHPPTSTTYILLSKSPSPKSLETVSFYRHCFLIQYWTSFIHSNWMN